MCKHVGTISTFVHEYAPQEYISFGHKQLPIAVSAVAVYTHPNTYSVNGINNFMLEDYAQCLSKGQKQKSGFISVLSGKKVHAQHSYLNHRLNKKYKLYSF